MTEPITVFGILRGIEAVKLMGAVPKEIHLTQNQYDELMNDPRMVLQYPATDFSFSKFAGVDIKVDATCSNTGSETIGS